MKQSHPENIEPELNSTSQQFVARVVSALPDDQPSMAWRSGLNEQLLIVAAKRRKRSRLIAWTLRPALGLGLASAVMVAMVTSRTPSRIVSKHEASVEGLVVAEHQQSSDLAQVSWVDRSSLESTEPSPKPRSTVNWSELDTESL